jgi:hypothetical protein
MCLAAAIGLAGSVVSGIGAAQQAKAQQASINAQAKLQGRQMQIDRETTGYEVSRTQDKIDRTLGAQRAGFISSGVGLSGSALDIMGETETEGALDVAAIRWNSKLRQDNIGYEQKITKMNAKDAGRAATTAFLAPVIGGAARFAGSFS